MGQTVPTIRRTLDENAGTLRTFVKDPVNRRLTVNIVTELRYTEGVYLTPSTRRAPPK